MSPHLPVDRLTPLQARGFVDEDASDPLVVPRSFTEWRQEVDWAVAVYHQALSTGPGAHTRFDFEGSPREAVNLASYNYLGLAQHEEVLAGARSALMKYGTGAGGSPMICGNTDLHRELEQELSAFLHREDTLLFPSGFAGALGVLAGLLKPGDLAALDARSHFSLQEGVKLSGADLRFFRHNDPSSLDRVLRRAKGKRRLVVVEGMYSMDGDFADLRALLAVIESHGASLMIDEAHSVLACGEHGRGVAEVCGVEERVGLYYGTLSKAFAGLGGFASGPAELIAYLRYFARSHAYSCALPPATVGGLLAALRVARREPELRLRLAENAAYLRAGLQRLGYDVGESCSHVVPIIVGEDRERMYKASLEMRRRGLFLAVVDYPAVPKNAVRFRASVSATHCPNDLDRALDIIQETLPPEQLT